MSRSISIWYQRNNVNIDIEVGNSDLLGAQNSSKDFWSNPLLKDYGINRLAELGNLDPVCFVGWSDLKILEKEISILEKEVENINFDKELKHRWLQNLRFCIERLKELAPLDSVPKYMIG